MNTKFFLFFISLFIIPFIHAALQGVIIGTDDYVCQDSAETADGICPSDYGSADFTNCEACLNADNNYVNDPDCCSPIYCSFDCTDAGVVCGDSSDERQRYETDSQGDTVTDSSPEDCYGLCISGTEHVIDDDTSWGCLDTAYDDPYSCADDGEIYSSIVTTANACENGNTCHDTDTDGDYELCDGGNWHDPDESQYYCEAAGYAWILPGVEFGIDSDKDDYDNDLSNGYCDGDDGFVVIGAIVAETYRGSGECEAAAEEVIGTPVTVTIKDIDDTSTIASIETTYQQSWTEETLSCQDTNDVGSYEFALPAGTYYRVTEADGYNTVTNIIDVSADETAPLFWIYLNDACQSDCTMNDDICHASCQGVNGCAFSSYEGKSIGEYCEGYKKGYRYVLSEQESGSTVTGDEVYCCTGEPQEYEREYFDPDDSQTNCVENVISQSKGVWLNGEWVDVHFVVFDDPHPEKTGCNEYAAFACEVYGDAFC